MTLSLRLSSEVARRLEAAARRNGLSKSELVRRCLEQYLAGEEDRPSAWDLGKDLFGQCGSGQSHLARNRKRIVKEKVHASNRHD